MVQKPLPFFFSISMVRWWQVSLTIPIKQKSPVPDLAEAPPWQLTPCLQEAMGNQDLSSLLSINWGYLYSIQAALSHISLFQDPGPSCAPVGCFCRVGAHVAHPHPGFSSHKAPKGTFWSSRAGSRCTISLLLCSVHPLIQQCSFPSCPYKLSQDTEVVFFISSSLWDYFWAVFVAAASLPTSVLQSEDCLMVL